MGKARLRIECALAGMAAAWLAWTGAAAEMSGRKVAWAHYVGWNPPQNVSLAAWDNYDAPVHDAGAGPLKDEVARALEMGIDGFLIDVCVVGEKGDSAFWDLRLVVDGERISCGVPPPRRIYGNCQPDLGEGVNGPNPTVAELFDLEY